MGGFVEGGWRWPWEWEILPDDGAADDDTGESVWDTLASVFSPPDKPGPFARRAGDSLWVALAAFVIAVAVLTVARGRKWI